MASLFCDDVVVSFHETYLPIMFSLEPISSSPEVKGGNCAQVTIGHVESCIFSCCLQLKNFIISMMWDNF